MPNNFGSIGDDITCDKCGTIFSSIDIVHSEDIPPLNIGTLVKVINRQHAWYDQIAIIRAKKHKFYRIEIFNTLLWVPEDWVIEDDFN